MKKFMRFLVSLLLIALIVGSIGWYLFVYDRDFTRDMLLSQARYQDRYGNARLSALFYDLAYEHSGRDENVAIELADQYKAEGNYTKAELTLSRAIQNKGTVELYAALSKTFVEQDKLLDAVNMLDNISDPVLKEALDSLRPAAPVTNYETGFYSQYIEVELSSTAGSIYYTTDGEYPSVSNPPFSGAFALDAGETLLYAISVDNSGLVSPLSIVGYTVGGVIEPIEFTDAATEALIREAIGANLSDILYTNELWDITEFTVPENADSIADLKYLPNLKKLTIHNRSLDSLALLGDMDKLQELDLTGCTFAPEELSTLVALPALSRLTLAQCNLSTIAGLENAENLTYLDLSSNTVRNLEAVATMTSLKELNLRHNAVTNMDISLDQLSGLSQLEKLDISYNTVSDLRALSSCVKLTWLDASNNMIAMLDGLDNLSLLTHLAVDHNLLTDVSIVSACSELTSLSFSNNEVTGIAALSGLLKLETLDFSNNYISALPVWEDGCALRTITGSGNLLTTIDSLKELDQISYIYMDYNQITNVDALADCYHLVQLNVYGNDIDSVALLTDHDIIVNFDPT